MPRPKKPDTRPCVKPDCGGAMTFHPALRVSFGAKPMAQAGGNEPQDAADSGWLCRVCDAVAWQKP